MEDASSQRVVPVMVEEQPHLMARSRLPRTLLCVGSAWFLAGAAALYRYGVPRGSTTPSPVVPEPHRLRSAHSDASTAAGSVQSLTSANEHGSVAGYEHEQQMNYVWLRCTAAAFGAGALMAAAMKLTDRYHRLPQTRSRNVGMVAMSAMAIGQEKLQLTQPEQEQDQADAPRHPKVDALKRRFQQDIALAASAGTARKSRGSTSGQRHDVFADAIDARKLHAELQAEVNHKLVREMSRKVAKPPGGTTAAIELDVQPVKAAAKQQSKKRQEETVAARVQQERDRFKQDLHHEGEHRGRISEELRRLHPTEELDPARVNQERERFKEELRLEGRHRDRIEDGTQQPRFTTPEPIPSQVLAERDRFKQEVREANQKRDRINAELRDLESKQVRERAKPDARTSSRERTPSEQERSLAAVGGDLELGSRDGEPSDLEKVWQPVEALVVDMQRGADNLVDSMQKAATEPGRLFDAAGNAIAAAADDTLQKALLDPQATIQAGLVAGKEGAELLADATETLIVGTIDGTFDLMRELTTPGGGGNGGNGGIRGGGGGGGSGGGDGSAESGAEEDESDADFSEVAEWDRAPPWLLRLPVAVHGEPEPPIHDGLQTMADGRMDASIAAGIDKALEVCLVRPVHGVAPPRNQPVPGLGARQPVRTRQQLDAAATKTQTVVVGDTHVTTLFPTDNSSVYQVKRRSAATVSVPKDTHLLVFDGSDFNAVSIGTFSQQLLAELTRRGITAASLETMEVRMREGSAVVEVSGSAEAMKELADKVYAKGIVVMNRSPQIYKVAAGAPPREELDARSETSTVATSGGSFHRYLRTRFARNRSTRSVSSQDRRMPPRMRKAISVLSVASAEQNGTMLQGPARRCRSAAATPKAYSRRLPGGCRSSPGTPHVPAPNRNVNGDEVSRKLIAVLENQTKTQRAAVHTPNRPARNASKDLDISTFAWSAPEAAPACAPSFEVAPVCPTEMEVVAVAPPMATCAMPAQTESPEPVAVGTHEAMRRQFMECSTPAAVSKPAASAPFVDSRSPSKSGSGTTAESPPTLPSTPAAASDRTLRSGQATQADTGSLIRSLMATTRSSEGRSPTFQSHSTVASGPMVASSPGGQSVDTLRLRLHPQMDGCDEAAGSLRETVSLADHPRDTGVSTRFTMLRPAAAASSSAVPRRATHGDSAQLPPGSVVVRLGACPPEPNAGGFQGVPTPQGLSAKRSAANSGPHSRTRSSVDTKPASSFTLFANKPGYR